MSCEPFNRSTTTVAEVVYHSLKLESELIEEHEVAFPLHFNLTTESISYPIQRAADAVQCPVKCINCVVNLRLLRLVVGTELYWGMK